MNEFMAVPYVLSDAALFPLNAHPTIAANQSCDTVFFVLRAAVEFVRRNLIRTSFCAAVPNMPSMAGGAFARDSRS
jgi:hypothetical protein